MTRTHTMIAAILLATLALILTPITSTARGPQQQRIGQTTQSPTVFQYAELTFLENGNVQFDQGGNQPVRTWSVLQLQRELGDRNRGGRINLLNAIGQNGWELIQPNSSDTWLFKRTD